MSKEKKSVIVYSTPTCPYCDQVKDYLKEKKISYQEIDLSKNPEKGEELVKKTGQMGVPVTIVSEGDEEEVIIGFDIDKISNALSL
jgi:glutaredoxin 3